MSLRRIVALALVASVGIGMTAALVAAPQSTGIIGGKATDQAKKPYSDYSVLVRDVSNGQVVSTVALDAQGLFSFNNLPLAKRYSVELFNIKENKLVCTEGPYALSNSLMTKTDVNINCGSSPVAWWLIVAGAGAAAAVAFAVRSASR